MNRKVLILSLIALLACQSKTAHCQIIKTTNMDTIEFFPKEFHQVKLNLNNRTENICTPYYPHNALKMPYNQLFINVPEKIICKAACNSLIIPMCSASMIRARRAAKYGNFSTPIVHVRKIGEDTWVSGEVVRPDDDDYLELPPDHEEVEKRRQQIIQDAQKYTDEELDERVGQSFGSAINVNVADYIDIQFEDGIYEIYLSMFGLESNRAKVEIIFQKNKK
jgi:hypothetical protein